MVITRCSKAWTPNATRPARTRSETDDSVGAPTIAVTMASEVRGTTTRHRAYQRSGCLTRLSLLSSAYGISAEDQPCDGHRRKQQPTHVLAIVKGCTGTSAPADDTTTGMNAIACPTVKNQTSSAATG